MKKALRIIILLVVINILSIAQNINRLISEGLELSNKKKYEEAIQLFTKALEIDYKYAEVYCHRGLAKFEIKDFYGAIKDFEKLLELGHSDERYIFLSWYTLGLSNYNITKYERAIDCFDSALTIRPKNSDIFMDRGKAKINLGRIEHGCEDLSNAGELGKTEAYELIKKYCVNSVLYEKEIQWIKYGETIYYEAYYNPDSIKKLDDVVEVTSKEVISDRNYEVAKQFILGELNLPKFKTLKYMITKYSVNINTEMTRTDEIEMYNKDNSLIEKNDMRKFNKEYLESGGWSKPIKNSIHETLVNVIKLKLGK